MLLPDLSSDLCLLTCGDAGTMLSRASTRSLVSSLTASFCIFLTRSMSSLDMVVYVAHLKGSKQPKYHCSAGKSSLGPILSLIFKGNPCHVSLVADVILARIPFALTDIGGRSEGRVQSFKIIW